MRVVDPTTKGGGGGEKRSSGHFFFVFLNFFLFFSFFLGRRRRKKKRKKERGKKERERKNIEIVNFICEYLDMVAPSKNPHKKLIRFVNDRPGHDLRYAINSSKLKNELNWKPRIQLEKGLKDTINWYINNKYWFKKDIK